MPAVTEVMVGADGTVAAVTDVDAASFSESHTVLAVLLRLHPSSPARSPLVGVAVTRISYD